MVNKELVGSVIGLSVFCMSQAMADDKPPFRIGVVLSKTGAYSQQGVFVEQGLRVGVKRANEAGGILGRKIELVIRDSASNPARGLLAAKELIGEQHVDFLYPEIISGIALAELPYATEQKMFTIANGASPLIGDVGKFPYSFQYLDSATRRIPAMAAAIKKLGGRKVGILVSTNPPQQDLGDGLNRDLKAKYGLEVAGYKQFSVDSKDLSPLLQALRDAGADIVAFDGAGRDNLRVVMTGMQTLGWNANVVGEPAVLYGDLLEQIPSSVAKQFYSINYRVATRTGATSPLLQQYIKDLEELGPITNFGFSAAGTDVITIVKWAYEKSQKQYGAVDADKLKTIVENIAKSDFRDQHPLLFDDPGYSDKDHTTKNADYSRFWSLVHASKPEHGLYEGEDLDVPND
jgi:branched-chain amino acid transport system substrate-binding protein